MLGVTTHTTEQYQSSSFSVDVLKRILIVLSENGKTKRTNLAGKTGLNYIVCLRYINFMKTLAWIEVVTDEDENEYVSVTTVGRQIVEALSNFLDGRYTSPVDYSGLVNGNAVESVATPITSFSGRNDQIVDENRSQPDLPPNSENDRPVRARPQRILLIDDEPDVALTYKSFLASEGYQVDAFREPERAVEHFISSRPSYYDLVITDIRMHEMNGLRLFQCLKSIDPSVKVVFITALDAAQELVSVVSPEPVRILRKPVDKQVFNRYVKSVLQAKS